MNENLIYKKRKERRTDLIMDIFSSIWGIFMFMSLLVTISAVFSFLFYLLMKYENNSLITWKFMLLSLILFFYINLFCLFGISFIIDKYFKINSKGRKKQNGIKK